MQLSFPESFRKTIRNNYGEEGEKWMDSLPKILKKCEELWDIHVEKASYELSYNYITDVMDRNGEWAVLKIGFPGEYEVKTEMDALRAFEGNHCVRLLAADKALSAMLLERIWPGTLLKELQKTDDAKATQIAAEIIRDTPVPVPSTLKFPTIAKWAEILSPQERKQFEGSPLTERMIDRAWSLFHELQKTSKEGKLLHGDIHHENILFDEKRGWLAVDPKGIIGEPAFNAARFLRNTNFENQLRLEERIEIVASVLQEEKLRLTAWAYIDRIFSTSWSIQSKSDTWKESMKCAEELTALLDTHTHHRKSSA